MIFCSTKRVIIVAENKWPSVFYHVLLDNGRLFQVVVEQGRQADFILTRGDDARLQAQVGHGLADAEVLIDHSNRADHAKTA
jgi:hypothetical protein